MKLIWQLKYVWIYVIVTIIYLNEYLLSKNETKIENQVIFAWMLFSLQTSKSG